MAEKDWISTVKGFVTEQLSGIENNILYAEDVGGVKYEFVLEFPDDIPTKTGISGSEIVDVNKTLNDTIVNVQRVFPDGEIIVDYSFNALGKGGDVEALDKFNKILKEGKGMKGVLLDYYDTFPVETTLPTTLENDITIPNTPEGIDTPTNVVDDIIDFQNTLRTKYADVLADIKIGGMKQPVLVLSPIPERNSFLLNNLYIDETMQSKGYGTQIMNDIIEFADNNNLQVELDISATNKSLANYYERFGFVLSDETDRDMVRKPNTPTNVVDDVTPASVVDEAVEYIDNLNIDNAIKKEVKDKIVKVTGQASGQIPIPGVGQAIDAWETAVLAVGAVALAAGEIDELPKVIYNYGLDLYESILSGYNIPFQPAKRKEYNPNFERISSGLTWIDKLQPTSYVINPVIEEFQETAATTPTMEVPGFGTVPASEYYQPPVQSTPERDNINTIMTNLMQNISNAQGAYPITASEIGSFTRNPIRVVPQDTADKPEKVEYDSKEKQNLHDIYAKLYKNLSDASARIQ